MASPQEVMLLLCGLVSMATGIVVLYRYYKTKPAVPQDKYVEPAEFAIMRELLARRGYLNSGVFTQNCWAYGDHERKVIVRKGHPSTPGAWVAEVVFDTSAGLYYWVERRRLGA